MEHVNYIIDCLEKTPVILQGLLAQIPEERYKLRRISTKWSIHEQVCHLIDAQNILMSRFKQFEIEKTPDIKSHNPLEELSTDYYLTMNMKEMLLRFPSIRQKMVNTLKAYDNDYWTYQGNHEAFSPYSSKILLNHSLNVDYAHMFSIEQLGLTKPEFENEILTIP